MSTQTKYIIEIATTDFNTTAAAVEGGADRIELCAALTDGGTTPSYATIKRCRGKFSVQLFPIVRPRGGDFFYNEDEWQLMRDDVKLCKDLGCDGVVIGALATEGTIPLKEIGNLVEIAYPLDVTFHRAFDRCREPLRALEQLIDLGCTRILTSGQQPSAPQGMALIAELVKAAGNRIVIMPGSGVRKENIRQLAEETGAVEFHSSLRGTQRSVMQFVHPAFAQGDESYANPYVHSSEVAALRNALP